ncbi:MAG: hypothetical protein KC516_02205 [Nanoarchaeota archaeon]|nr:hypothetical protein [Nanoarchaeota archaeon]
MPFNPSEAQGYSPSIEELMNDLKIESLHEFRETLLDRCNFLHENAKKNRKINSFKTKQEFILCNSTEFYQTLVNMGYGNSALIIKDDFSPKKFFLMFEDKLPEKFRHIVAKHESYEYDLVSMGVPQYEAHINASELEIKTASELGLKKEYTEFLKQEYPLKLKELKENNLV